MRGMTTASRRSLVGSAIRGDILLATFGGDPAAATTGDDAGGWPVGESALPVCAERVFGSTAGAAPGTGPADAADFGCGAVATGAGDGAADSALRTSGSFAGPVARSFGVDPGEAGCDGAGCEIAAGGAAAGGTAAGGTAAGGAAGFCSAATGACGGDTIDAAGSGCRSGCRDAITDSGVAGDAGVCDGAEGASAATVAGARKGISTRDATLSEALI